MYLKTPAEIGMLVRDRRQALGLDQATLAARIGTSRRWIIDLERGKETLSLNLVLKALRALDIRLNAETGAHRKTKQIQQPDDLDLALTASIRDSNSYRKIQEIWGIAERRSNQAALTPSAGSDAYPQSEANDPPMVADKTDLDYGAKDKDGR